MYNINYMGNYIDINIISNKISDQDVTTLYVMVPRVDLKYPLIAIPEEVLDIFGKKS